MGKRPGVMFYFEVRSCLKRLSDAEKGRLFEAILDYGQYGAVPELEGALGVAWDFIQPRIDRDGEQYEEISRKRSEAAHARWDKERANASGAVQIMPTTNSNSKPNTNSFSTSIPAPKPTPEQQAEFDFNHHRKEVLDRFNAYTGRR